MWRNRLAREALLTGAAGWWPAPWRRWPSGAVRPCASLAESRCVVVMVGGRAWDPLWSREVPYHRRPRRPSTPMADGGRGRTPWTARRSTASRPRRPVDSGSRPSRSAGRPSSPGARPPPPGRAARRRATCASRVALRRTPPVSNAWHGGSRPGPGGTTWSSPATVVASCADVVASRCATASGCSTSGAWADARRRVAGVKALFAGDSGTGKTMSAEIVAGRPRAGPVRHRPVDGRRQVRRGDREEPGPHLRRGRPGQRRAAVRRGGRTLRQDGPRSATPRTATPTSRSPTCSSAWSRSTAWPS